MNLIPYWPREQSLPYLEQSINIFGEGDKAGKMLAWYIRQQENVSIILGVMDEGGNLQSSSTSINKKFRAYYKNLYKSELQGDS